MSVQSRRLLAVAVFAFVCLRGVGDAQRLYAPDDPPLLVRVRVDYPGYWVDGAPKIWDGAWLLVHPASGSVRIGDLTLPLQAYEPGVYVIAGVYARQHLSVVLVDHAFVYIGVDGFVGGTVE